RRVDGSAPGTVEQVCIGQQPLCGGQREPFAFDARVDQATALQVFFTVVERLDQHALDVVVAEAVARLHRDLLRNASGGFARAHFEQIVFVDVQLDLEPR